MRTLLSISLLSLGVLVLSGSARADDFNSNGVRIHYVVQGHGAPVVLIHGLDSSAAINWGLPGITSALAKNRQVIALDCRGHGQSDKPDEEGAYGVQMVEDVVRLMDHLQIAKAQIVAYSMGGMIAMKLVATHPDRVSAVVLGGMGWLRPDSPIDRVWANIGQRGGGATTRGASDGRGRGAPIACLHGFPALAITEAELRAITAPVTVVVGDKDPTRLAFVEPLQKVRPDWPVRIVADAGHVNCIFKPDFKRNVEVALASRR